jgi:hypothetical protein
LPLAYLPYVILSSRPKAEKHREPPLPQEKPKTGVGSEAWEANRLREIRELREKEGKKAAELRESQADIAEK